MKDTKMIILDLDQTLLRTNKTISDYTINVLNQCKETGIKIVYATARSKGASKRFIERYEPDIFIGYGGALVQVYVLSETPKIIYKAGIPADISTAIITDLLNEPEVVSILAINETVALTNDIDELSMTDNAHYTYTENLLDYNYSYLKISTITANEEAMERIAAKYPTIDMLRYSGEDLFRFVNQEALKWNAIQAIADYYDISTDQLIAFGDDIIDLEMIQKCGIGIAVANAVPQIKSAADYICGSNDDDGVAQWLESNLIIKK